MRLNRRKFRAWLEAKPPAEIVGVKRDCHCCPVATFYSDTAGNDVVFSGRGDGYRVDYGSGDRLPPTWAANFFRIVDAGADETITAGRALEILSEC